MKTKTCSHCNQNLSIDNFYINKKTGIVWPYCRLCESKRKKQQLINFKKDCLTYLNQFSCKECGYDKNVCALDFHHIDATLKDFNISKCKKLTLNDSIKRELDKCIVLCSNCHREFHSLEEGVFEPNKLSPRSPKYCCDCGQPCTYYSTRCVSCNKVNASKKSKCPSRDILQRDIQELKYFTQIAKKYEVSDNTIRKWCKKLDIKV